MRQQKCYITECSDTRDTKQTLGRKDGRAPARAYAMKAVEDTDTPDVIVGNFTVFDISMHVLIDPG